ncbi:MAG: hypothetical protein KJS95_08465, partial [Gammaproteobacteria bacterium]|nr:hypothetical protein [Gammaproteobacteria bacterium]
MTSSATGQDAAAPTGLPGRPVDHETSPVRLFCAAFLESRVAASALAILLLLVALAVTAPWFVP